MRRRPLFTLLCAATALIAGAVMQRAAAQSSATVAETLRRQTQEMVDALVPGTAAVWDRYLDAAAVVTTEDGTVMNKAQMVRQTVPLPPGVSGSIKVVDFKVALHGTTAVATYIDDENESYHGQVLRSQYRTTDTWVSTAAGWRLIASQVLAVRTDPPAIPLAARQVMEYCGRYSLTADVHYDVRCAGGALQGQQTGHKPEKLLAEAPDVLFAPGRPRYRMVFHRNALGRVTGFAERREAWSLEWRREP